VELNPNPILKAEKIYRNLLRLYPKNYRQEFGTWMVQVFRDVCRDAYRLNGRHGITRVWLKTLPDLTVSVLQEYEDEVRRWFVNKSNSNSGADPRSTMGLLVGAVLIALGLLASVVIREAGGSPTGAAAVAVAFNLAGAIVMELMGDRSGAILGSMCVMFAGYLLPLFWVSDPDAWLRENPVNSGILILIAASLRSRFKSNWPIYVVAILIGGVHILISFL
jgi:hypothetical protein